MRKSYIAANWKMNKNIEESKDFFNKFLSLLDQNQDKKVMIAPSFTALKEASILLKNSNVLLGAQNMSAKESGA